jgi:hypothetical protein
MGLTITITETSPKTTLRPDVKGKDGTLRADSGPD